MSKGSRDPTLPHPFGGGVPRAALAVLALAILPPTIRGQGCETVESRTTLSALSGRQIDFLNIATLPPKPLPGLTNFVNLFHVRTRDATIRRRLLFAAGDTVDTLRISESLRRLREDRLFSDVAITGHACPGESGVTLVLSARDVITARPRLRLAQSGTSVVGLEERNLLGTGRSLGAAITLESGRIGEQLTFADPAVLGRQATLNARFAEFKDGYGWRGVLGSRERSVYDPWRATLFAARSRREAPVEAPVDYLLERQTLSLLVARTVSASPTRVGYLMAGAEDERSLLSVSFDSPIIGPADVERRYRGLDVGAGVRTAKFTVIDWLVPSGTLVDIPEGIEGETLLSVGRERTVGEPMERLDGWVGQMWRPRPSRLIIGDLWASGYYATGGVRDGSVRAAVSAYQEARRGLWMARIAAERSIEPDPDVRALATVDPLVQLTAVHSRLARFAALATLERSVHVWTPISSMTVDAALFGALSLRRGSVNPTSDALDDIYAVVLGTGIRFVPHTSGGGPTRVDIGWPIARSGQLRRRVFLAVSVVPWIGADRRRDAWRNR